MAQWYSFGRSEHGELGTGKAGGPSNEGDWGLGRAVIPEAAGTAQPGKVRCGQYHNVATSSVPEQAPAFSWGVNSEGQLALQAPNDHSKPAVDFVASPTPCLEAQRSSLEGEQVVECCAGRTHSIFLTKPSGRVFIAGHLPSSPALPAATDEASSDTTVAAAAPTEGARAAGHLRAPREVSLSCLDSVRGPYGKVIACSAGERSSYVLTNEGEVFSVVDVPSSSSPSSAPSLKGIANLPVVARIASGAHHTLFLTMEAHVFAVGSGNFGQLGLGHTQRHADQPVLVKLPSLCDGRVRDLAAGHFSSFVITAMGTVFAWGCNACCQLGLGTSVQGVSVAKSVDCLAHIRVVQVAAGGYHTACVSSDGALYLWGSGSYGQLGFAFDETKACSVQACAGSSTCSRPPTITDKGVDNSAGAGHSSPWVQVWPRRSAQGPFLKRRCREVQCGAYHTVACASDELIDAPQAQIMEVLTPPPPLRRASGSPNSGTGNVGAGSGATSSSKHGGSSTAGGSAAAAESSSAAEGKSGSAAAAATEVSAEAVEASRLRLNALSAAVRKTGVPLDSEGTTFHSLANLFWNIPSEMPDTGEKGAATEKAPAAKAKSTGRRPPDAGEWRRALLPQQQQQCSQSQGCEAGPAMSGSASASAIQPNPLCARSEETRKRVGIHNPTPFLRLPATGGPILWDVVDEALHQAFATGAAFETHAHVELPRLVQQVQSVQGPTFAHGRVSESKPLPPFKGIVRNESLIPRPFYLPEDRAQSGPVVGAAAPNAHQLPASSPAAPESAGTVKEESESSAAKVEDEAGRGQGEEEGRGEEGKEKQGDAQRNKEEDDEGTTPRHEVPEDDKEKQRDEDQDSKLGDPKDDHGGTEEFPGEPATVAPLAAAVSEQPTTTSGDGTGEEPDIVQQASVA